MSVTREGHPCLIKGEPGETEIEILSPISLCHQTRSNHSNRCLETRGGLRERQPQTRDPCPEPSTPPCSAGFGGGVVLSPQTTRKRN